MVFSLLNFENLLTGMLQRAIRKGTLSVHYPSGERANFGNGENPVATVHFQDAEAVRSVYFDPALKFAEMYMDGRMTIDDGELERFIEIVKINGAKKFATAPAVALSLWPVSYTHLTLQTKA